MSKKDSRTFIVIMPFTIEAGNAGKIIKQYLNTGLELKGIHNFTFTRKTAKAFLNKRVKKDVLNDTLDVMCEGPSMLIIFSGKNAIAKGKKVDGASHRKNYKWYDGVYTPVRVKAFEQDVKVIFKLIT